MNQMMSAAFLANLSLAQLRRSPKQCFQVTTQTEDVDQMCVQYATKVLKSCGVLDNHLTLEQLSNHELNCTQDKRYLLAGMLFAQKNGGEPLASRCVISVLPKYEG